MDDTRQLRSRAASASCANRPATATGGLRARLLARLLALAPLVIVSSTLLVAQDAPPIDVRQLFDATVLQRIELQVNSRDWDTLRANWKSSAYYPATFLWRGQTVRNVGIRSRGTGTRSGQKPGLLVDFNRFVAHQHFLGLNSVVLDNHLQDPSAMREALAMALYAKVGLPALRVAPAELWINGQFFGVYSLVENVDLVACRRLFPSTAATSRGLVTAIRPPEDQDPGGGDPPPMPAPTPPATPAPSPPPAPVKGPNGYVYEYHWKDYYYVTYLGSDLSRYARLLEAKSHESEPLETLYRSIETLLREINEAPDSQFDARVGALLDLPLFVKQLAVESYLAEWDGLAGAFALNNFYLVRPGGGGPYKIVPWDRDNSLRAVDYPLLVDQDKHVLVRRALQVPELRALYFDTLKRVVQEADARETDQAPTWLAREVSRRSELVAARVHDDHATPYSENDFRSAVEHNLAFARGRGEFVRQSAARLQASGALERR